MSSEELGFSFAGRTIDYFGSKAITSDITALFELIKNSRDANAKTVTVHFKDNTKTNAEIEVYDDGDGMSEKDVKEKWMVIGTDSRIKNNVTKSGKPVWGEMGIGRIACQKLSNETIMTSVKSNQRVKMIFNWKLFENPEITIEQIKFPKELSKVDNIENGVTLNLKNLKSKWTSKKIHDLKIELSRLISRDNFNDIEIFIKTGKEKKGDKIGKDYSKWNEKITSSAPFKLRGKFDGSKLTVEIFNQFGQRGMWEKQTVMGHYEDTEVGPFTLDVFHFPRAPGKQKSSTLEKYYENKIGVDSLEDFLKENFGLYLYRDGAWMKPYGGATDWLKMEAGARQETSKIGLKQIYGTVSMSKKKNPEIKPASHRETLIENQAFRDLAEIMDEVFQILRLYMVKLKSKQSEQKNAEMGGTTKTSEGGISDIIKNIKKITKDLPAREKSQVGLALSGIGELSTMQKHETEGKILEMGQMRHYEKNLTTL